MMRTGIAIGLRSGRKIYLLITYRKAVPYFTVITGLYKVKTKVQRKTETTTPCAVWRLSGVCEKSES